MQGKLSQVKSPLANLFAVFLLLTVQLFAAPQPLLIAVAADFSETLTELSVPFQKQTDIAIVQSSGDTGTLTQQILHGAPYDVFLSADESHPQNLDKAGKIVPGSRFTYAVGRLVLYAPGETISQTGRADLKAEKWTLLAMANPALAPYGVAAQQVLEKIAPQKIHYVLGQNIGQTFAYVKSGAVPAGFVALSQVMDRVQQNSPCVWLIPQNLYSPIKQQGVILSTTAHLAEAKQFMTFLKTPAAQSIMAKNGYTDVSH